MLIIKTRNAIILALLGFLATGCATFNAEYAKAADKQKAGDVQIVNDDFKNYQTVRLLANYANVVSPKGKTVSITPVLVKNSDGNSLYLTADIISPDFIFIQNNESLCFAVENDKFCLSTDGSSDYGVTRGVNQLKAREANSWPITKEQFEKLANAQSAKFKIYGKKGSVEGELTKGDIFSMQDNMFRLKSFYDKYVSDLDISPDIATR